MRNFIDSVLSDAYGEDWFDDRSHFTDEKIKKIRGRQKSEQKLEGITFPEDRVIYYSDFRDLKDIVENNWNEFEPAFKDLDRFLIFWQALANLRNPDAHHRELLPHQIKLVEGISGEIRNLIVRYKNMKESINPDDYFPVIETIRDNYGQTYDSEGISGKITLDHGDSLTIVVNASDPEEEDILYRFSGMDNISDKWTQNNVLETTADDAGNIYLRVSIKSKRDYHREGIFDDTALLSYFVTPPKD